MNEPPIKKAYISLPNTQCIINTGNDTDDDTESDVGIQFSVDSHSSSGDRCSNSLSPEGRRSFCSDGFQPSYEDILEFTSSDKGWQCVDNENNNTLITDDKTDDDDDDDTQKYELIINDSCSVASEGFNPYNASVKDIAEGTECITDRGLLSSNIEEYKQNALEDGLKTTLPDVNDSPEQSTSLKTDISKLDSMHKEAEVIADVLCLSDVDIIYKRICQLKTKANRSDIVMNEILAGGIRSFSEQVSSTNCKKEEDMKQVKDAVMAKCSDLKCGDDEVLALLEKYPQEADRVNIVVDLLLKENGKLTSHRTNATAKETREEELFHDVQHIQSEMPSADPNIISNLLDKFYDHKDRVSNVMSMLKDLDQCDVGKLKPSNSQSEFVGMPLYDDFKIVSSLFPNQDKNEIYAYLEAHYYNPNRIQVVIDELVQLEYGIQNRDESMKSESNQDQSSYICSLQKDVDTLRKIFPDCDPDFLFCELESMGDDDDMRTTKLASQLFNSHNYPLLKDRLKREEAMKRLTKLKQSNLDMDEFLKMFPNPEGTFYNENKKASDNYKRNAEHQLLNDFPMIRSSYIQKKFESHGYHYLPTKKDLDKSAAVYRNDPVLAVGDHKRFLVDHRNCDDSMPSELDEFFYRELLFARNEQRVLEHLQKVKDERVKLVAEARERGELLECPCCYDDDCLLEDMKSCPEGHLFCKMCLQQLAETNLAQGKLNFQCLDPYCELEFSLNTLQSVLSPNLFSVLLSKIQEDEVNRANINDLVSCPFCSFATIMPDPNDKVFKCFNPECLKESCRFCQEPNHVPLRCDEIEKESEKSMRAYIEKRMSEAMIRQCWKCKKSFYKVEGCNKMTCVCGASMCYVCRKPIKDYDHFADGRCSNQDASVLHLKEMKEAAQKAREEYEYEHPEACNYKLKYDPVKHLSESSNSHTVHHEVDINDDDDDDDFKDEVVNERYDTSDNESWDYEDDDDYGDEDDDDDDDGWIELC